MVQTIAELRQRHRLTRSFHALGETIEGLVVVGLFDVPGTLGPLKDFSVETLKARVIERYGDQVTGLFADRASNSPLIPSRLITERVQRLTLRPPFRA